MPRDDKKPTIIGLSFSADSPYKRYPQLEDQQRIVESRLLVADSKSKGFIDQIIAGTDLELLQEIQEADAIFEGAKLVGKVLYNSLEAAMRECAQDESYENELATKSSASISNAVLAGISNYLAESNFVKFIEDISNDPGETGQEIVKQSTIKFLEETGSFLSILGSSGCESLETKKCKELQPLIDQFKSTLDSLVRSFDKSEKAKESDITALRAIEKKLLGFKIDQSNVNLNSIKKKYEQLLEKSMKAKGREWEKTLEQSRFGIDLLSQMASLKDKKLAAAIHVTGDETLNMAKAFYQAKALMGQGADWLDFLGPINAFGKSAILLLRFLLSNNQIDLGIEKQLENLIRFIKKFENEVIHCLSNLESKIDKLSLLSLNIIREIGSIKIDLAELKQLANDYFSKIDSRLNKNMELLNNLLIEKEKYDLTDKVAKVRAEEVYKRPPDLQKYRDYLNEFLTCAVMTSKRAYLTGAAKNRNNDIVEVLANAEIEDKLAYIDNYLFKHFGMPPTTDLANATIWTQATEAYLRTRSYWAEKYEDEFDDPKQPIIQLLATGSQIESFVRKLQSNPRIFVTLIENYKNAVVKLSELPLAELQKIVNNNFTDEPLLNEFESNFMMIHCLSQWAFNTSYITDEVFYAFLNRNTVHPHRLLDKTLLKALINNLNGIDAKCDYQRQQLFLQSIESITIFAEIIRKKLLAIKEGNSDDPHVMVRFMINKLKAFGREYFPNDQDFVVDRDKHKLPCYISIHDLFVDDLCAAVKTNNIRALSKLLSYYPTLNLNARDAMGRSPVHYSIQIKSIETLKLLIAKGFDVNAQDRGGYTPLHFAAQTGAASFIRILLIAGARHYEVNNFGETPEMIATQQRQGQFVACLQRVLNNIVFDHANPYLVKNWQAPSQAVLKKVVSRILPYGRSQILTISGDGVISASDLYTGNTTHLATIQPLNTCYKVAFADIKNSILAYSSTNHDFAIYINKLAENTTPKILAGHGARISSFAVLENGYLASGAEHTYYAGGNQFLDTKIRIWDINTGACKQMLNGPNNGVTSLATLDDNLLLAAYGRNKHSGHVYIWDKNYEFKFNIKVQCSTSDVKCPDVLTYLGNKRLAIANGKNIYILELLQGTIIKTLTNTSGKDIHDIKLLTNNLLVSGSPLDDSLCIWDIDTGQIKNRLSMNGYKYKPYPSNQHSLAALTSYKYQAISIVVLENGITCHMPMSEQKDNIYTWYFPISTINSDHTNVDEEVETGEDKSNEADESKDDKKRSVAVSANRYSYWYYNPKIAVSVAVAATGIAAVALTRSVKCTIM